MSSKNFEKLCVLRWSALRRVVLGVSVSRKILSEVRPGFEKLMRSGIRPRDSSNGVASCRTGLSGGRHTRMESRKLWRC